MKLQKLVLSVVSKIKRLSVFAIVMVALLGGSAIAAAATIALPFAYHFDQAGMLVDAPSALESTSPYWWLASGGKLTIVNSIASTASGVEPVTTVTHQVY